MSCAACNRGGLGIATRTCGDTGYNGGSCSSPSIGGRHIGGGGAATGMIATYDLSAGRRCACPARCCFPPPCTIPPSQCPTMACCPQRCAVPACCETARVNFCCPDPCRPKLKPCCPPDPCCKPFPCFPKACCPCCYRPDPSLKKRCFIPSPCYPPPECSKLCLIPKHCPPCGCCAPIPVCPPCSPCTDGCCKSCAKPLFINPPSCKKPCQSGCESICCPRPPFGLVPCEGQFPDPYCCPKPNVFVLKCPFRAFPSQKTC